MSETTTTDRHRWAAREIADSETADTDGEVLAYYTGQNSKAELLMKFATMWTRNLNRADWADRREFAAICYRKSTLTVREAAGITGCTVEEVCETTVPEGPPWTLSDPYAGDAVKIVHEEKNSDGSYGE